jgi:PKD repeat protein
LILDDSVSVTLHTPPVAAITQIGNTLCAEPGEGTYDWYDCEMTQLLSFDSCLAILDTGCYCLVVSTPFCADTICGDFNTQPCDLTCAIELADTACLNTSIVFAYSGNASSGAVFNWLIDVPGFPMMPVSGNDTVILSYDTPGCYQVSLTVFDAGCLVTCTDSICIVGPQSTVSLCCGQEACDTCTTIEFTLTGPAPWTVLLTDGMIVDTITGITNSPYAHLVCPPGDTTITYTILQTNTCPAIMVGDSAVTVTLHPNPQASVIQSGDTLCAFPVNMAGYGWFTCPAGPYLDTSRCFVPAASGCYCVIVSTVFDCVDTACYSIILSDVISPESGPISVYPNPSGEFVTLIPAPSDGRPVEWKILNLTGQVIDKGVLTESALRYSWNDNLPPGVYLFQYRTATGYMLGSRLIRL